MPAASRPAGSVCRAERARPQGSGRLARPGRRHDQDRPGGGRRGGGVTQGTLPDFTIAPVAPDKEAAPWGLPPRKVTWYPSVANAFNNNGISHDTQTGAADFDGAGSSLSAEALASTGVTPGATLTHGGVRFTWPDVPAGQPDNVVAAAQGIKLSGAGGTLGFLATSTYGATSSAGSVVYSDGTTQQFVLEVPDWYGNPPNSSDELITMTYRNRPGNTQQTHAIHLFFVDVPLQQGKTVAGVVLPYVSDATTQGQSALHVFAIAIG